MLVHRDLGKSPSEQHSRTSTIITQLLTRQLVTKEASLQPPSKRLKFNLSENVMDEEYKEAVSALKTRRTGVKHLMFATQRKWIAQERPLVAEAVESFSFLASIKVVSLCMCACTVEPDNSVVFQISALDVYFMLTGGVNCC